jgi:hypothetical protein
MKLFLYNVTDDSQTINKTLGVGYELTINLKHDTDIINPSIILMSVLGVDFKNYNYAFIDGLERYYFIDKIQNKNAKLWELDLTCDVLETYKLNILNSNARFMRNIRTGDFVDSQIDVSTLSTVNNYSSDKGLNEGESSIIFTTMEI